MNTENRKTSEPHRLKLDLTDKLNLKNPNKNMALANLNILPNGEYSNLACSTVLGFKPKSSPVKYSYLSKLLEDNVDILAAFLSKSYCSV